MPALDLIDSDQIHPGILELIQAAPRPGLDKQPYSKQLASRIPSLAEAAALSGSLAESGLWLLVGDLDQSHTISQQDPSDLGSYWHGVMHRREGDFGNSKYWFRRVGDHPVLSELSLTISERTDQLTSGIDFSDYSDPNLLANAIIDDCQTAVSGLQERVGDLELICWWEWQLLFKSSTSS